MSSLAEKSVNYVGRVVGLVGEKDISDRLRELGFTTGESIRLVGVAPFGEPLMVEVRGAVVALRKAEAACIQI